MSYEHWYVKQIMPARENQHVLTWIGGSIEGEEWWDLDPVAYFALVERRGEDGIIVCDRAIPIGTSYVSTEGIEWASEINGLRFQLVDWNGTTALSGVWEEAIDSESCEECGAEWFRFDERQQWKRVHQKECAHWGLIKRRREQN